MKNNVYLVTGAARGIGAAVAGELAERGAAVVLVDLETAPIEDNAAALRDSGHRAIALSADISDAEAMNGVVAKIVEEFGHITGGVCNAGIAKLGNPWELTSQGMTDELRINVTGTFNTARSVAEQLRAQGTEGAVVMVASNCGKVGYDNMAGYNASKAAVINLARSLAREWAPENINVNCVCPGGVDTPMLEQVAEFLSPRIGQEPADILATMGSAQLGRKIQPVEVAKVIAFLLSDDAKIIRGQAINVDAGDTPY